MRLYFIIILSLFSSLVKAQSQNKHPFWDDVQTIRKYDKLYKPPVRPVLFVGSSSIRKWDDVQYTFAKYRALNRGIGGALLNDIIYYAEDLIFAYQPRQIVIYVGENDIVRPDENADTILNRTINLYQVIRAKMPEVPIVYISIKPSPSRDKYIQKAIDANRMIESFLKGQKNVVYVDVFHQMISKEGKARPELFVNDQLHLNADGYAIWARSIKRFLIKY